MAGRGRALEGDGRSTSAGAGQPAGIGWPGTGRPAAGPSERIDVAEEVRAEMVANVWKVVVAQGDTVGDGDTLVILESMKMEIPVLAESAGTVQELRVNEGDVVQEGDVIAVIG